MNVIEKVTDALGGLPAWLGATPTGKKLLSEKEESERKLAAEAVEERKRLVQQLEAAREAEASDQELVRMIAEQNAFVETAPKLKRTSIFASGSDGVKAEGMLKAISARQRVHRDRVDTLRRTLKETAPSWLRDMVTGFIANLDAIERATLANTERLDEQYGYDRGGNSVLVKIRDYAEYRALMIGRPGARGWIPHASKQARSLLLEAITSDEAKRRLDAIRKSEPKRKPTWRSVA